MYLKSFAVTVLAGLLITGTSLPQNIGRVSSQNERKLIKSNWRIEPFQVNAVKLKGQPAEFGKAFTDADDDWLKGFSLNVTNTSNKDAVFIELSLSFFGPEEKQMPARIPLEFPVFYGSPEGIRSTTTRAVGPKESVDVSFSDEEYDKLKEGLLSIDYPLKFHHVDVRVDKVVYADGQVWYKGYYFRRDPSNPNRFIRDRSF